MKQKQRGMVVPFLVMAVAGVVLLFVASMHSTAMYADKLDEDVDRARVVEGAMQQLESWYRSEAGDIESNNLNPTEAQLLSRIAERKYGLRAAFSARLGLPCPGGAVLVTCVPFRRIVVWLPPVSDPSTASFNSATGVFTQGNVTAFKVFETRDIQIANAQRAYDHLDSVALAIQRYAQVRGALLPYGSGRINHLRPVSCLSVQLGELPCVDTYTDIETSGVLALVGLTAAEAVSPMGGRVQFSNLAGSSSAAPPFSASLQVMSPWGTSLVITVVQSF